MLPTWPTSQGTRALSRRAHRLAVPCPAVRHARGATQCVPVAGTGDRRLAAPLRASAGDAAPAPAPGADSAGTPVAAEQAASPEGILSPDDIRAMVREQQEQEEELQSLAMAQPFQEDPEGLYEYVDRAYAAGPRHVRTPLNSLIEDMSGVPTTAWPAAVANDIVGMGSWRLRVHVDPIIQFLVPRLEGCWREILDTDLCLYPRDKWKEKGWDLVDSEDPKRELDGFSYADIPDPEEGAKGFPRLLIENRVYCSKVFRKLHVEVAVRQDGMQVLHVVAYPRYRYDMPIFGLDIVVVGERVTLAVVDLCPVRKDLKLQPHYLETMALLQRTFFEGQDPASRRIPDWGKATFSPLAVVMSPKSEEELAAFLKYAVALHRAYLTMSLNGAPVVAGPGDRAAAARLEELLHGQKRFCDNQLVNKKTRRVLEVAFGAEWTEEYMSKLMFDFDPSYEPPYFDASYERLYTYFDENPSFGDLADEAMGLESAYEGERALESLQGAAMGKPVSQEKLKMAVQFLVQSDPAFAAAVQTLNSNQEVPPEELLSSELMALLRPQGGAAQKG